MKKRELVNVKEPQLYREIFPYTEVTRTLFDFKTVKMEIPEEIWISDTTFRDGQQARAPYTPEQILRLYRFFQELDNNTGVIRQCEFFLYTNKDRKAVELCMEQNFRYPEITGWIRAVKSDFELVKKMNLKETGILTSCSDYHIYLKLGMDRKKALEKYIEIVEEAVSHNIIPRCHFEDITRADIYGFVIPFAQKLMDISHQAKMPVKIRMCDTLGYGLPFPEAKLPRSVPKIVRALIEEAGVKSEYLQWHGHNDFHKVVINGVASWLYGCCDVDTTILGFGERTGNPPMEAMIIEYIGLKGNPGLNTRVISEIVEYYEKELHEHIPTNMPYVGRDCNATRAGIHADGILKNKEIYSIFDMEKILNKPLEVIITDKSGAAGVAHWVNNFLKLPPSQQISKRHPGIQKMYKAIMKEYEEGRVTGMGYHEMVALAKKYLPEYFISDLDKIKKEAFEMAKTLIEKYISLPEIISMEPQQQQKILKEIVEENPFVQCTYIVNTEGHMITGPITHPEEISEFEPLKKEENFSDRDWFKGPFRGLTPYVTGLYTSRFTNALCVTVSDLIEDEMGNIKGVLGIDIKFEHLVKLEDSEED